MNVNTQDSEKSNSKTELVKMVKIENSPFTAIKQDEDDKWIIVMGENLASSKRFDELIDAEMYVESKPWELIMIGSIIFMQKTSEINKENNSKN